MFVCGYQLSVPRVTFPVPPEGSTCDSSSGRHPLSLRRGTSDPREGVSTWAGGTSGGGERGMCGPSSGRGDVSVT